MTTPRGGTSATAEIDGMRFDAFDPVRDPALFAGVRWRRTLAFLVDATLILMLTAVAGVGVFLLGIVTFGLAWFFYLFLWQGVALLYTAATLGGRNSATPGMRLMGLEMRLWYGAPVYPLLAVVHAIAFWLSVSLLTPLVLIATFLGERKRLLHDMLLGTVVVDSDALRRIA
jgi:uncharacterized RDD family membrane protein YckC